MKRLIDEYPVVVSNWLDSLEELDQIIKDMKKTCCKWSNKEINPAAFIVCHTAKGFILLRKLIWKDKANYDFMVRLRKQHTGIVINRTQIVLKWNPEKEVTDGN